MVSGSTLGEAYPALLQRNSLLLQGEPCLLLSHQIFPFAKATDASPVTVLLQQETRHLVQQNAPQLREAFRLVFGGSNHPLHGGGQKRGLPHVASGAGHSVQGREPAMAAMNSRGWFHPPPLAPAHKFLTGG